MKTKLLSSNKLVLAVLCIALLLILLDIFMAFFISPLVRGARLSEPVIIAGQMVANKLLFSQKIFYLHVPVALSSFIALLFTAVFSIRYLIKRDPLDDMRAYSCTEIALVFVLATMASGILWTRFEWGSWWVWEPRLTTYFILTLMVLAYFVLRLNIEDADREASFAAVFGILAFINVPISFFVTRLVPSSIHPVIFRTDSGLSSSMLIPFIAGMIGCLLLSFVLYKLRISLKKSDFELQQVKEEFESLYKKRLKEKRVEGDK